MLLEASFESGDELAAKDATEYADGQEEGIAGTDPAGVVWGKTSGRNHTMEVGMKQQVLPPTVQHGEKTDLSAQMFRVGSDLQQGLGAGAEQQVIEDLFVDQGQRREMVR